MNNPNARSRRLNILILDGGGVRGLSSLLVLQALMVQVNQNLARLGAASSELHPHHVFQLVAGTSTGGLIALMLGKMGMTVDECITKYEELSKVVFGKKHFRGRITHGLAPAKYSGKRLQKCIQDLLRDRQLDENLSMRSEADKIACAVICREHCSSSQYSKLKSNAVPICSLSCKDNLVCKVHDAARATSAAPTFFPVMRIESRFFVDGGLQHNNPSFAIYFHYVRNEFRKSARRFATSHPHYSPHGDLDCSRVRFTNIGTGAKGDEVEPGKRDRFIPGFLRQGIFLKQTLTDIAVNSEAQAAIMQQFNGLGDSHCMYERFDAGHGVSNIELDDHKALGQIRKRTELYLEEPETKDLLQAVGSAIATDYLNSQSFHRPTNNATSPAIEGSCQAPKAMTAGPVSLPSSSGPAGHNIDPADESSLSSLHHDKLLNGGSAPLNRILSPSPPEVHKHPLYPYEDSGFESNQPRISMLAALA